MAARVLLRRRFAPAATGVVVAGLTLFPKTSLHAEAPNASESKKPIYDDFEATPTPPIRTTPSPDATRTPTNSVSPTPTERLAAQIGKSRIFLHAHVAAAENKVNEFMDSVFDLEESFTTTIASLVPAPQTGERLMPGTLYVLVAAMSGSIISRNRNIALRAVVPIVVGIGAGWVVLPYTMRNVSNLLWKYEQRFPVIADTHLRARASIQEAWRMARIHTEQAVNVVDDKVSAGRGAVEGWVKKGK